MKQLPSSKLLFILALSLVLLVNAFILVGVWYNRSGDAESTVVLTERELRMPYRWSKDQTSVRINWRIISSEGDSYNLYNSPTWFDQQKLVSLGFEFSADLEADTETHFIEAEAILVLEYDGDAYQQTLKIAKNRIEMIAKKLIKLVDDEELLSDLKAAKETLKHEKYSASRLFVIDAGLDRKKLRILYPDIKRYILAYGIVDVRGYRPYDNSKKSEIAGRIDRLSIERLYIGTDVHAQIDQLRQNSKYTRNENPPRFSLEVYYGQKLEPWINKFYLLNAK